MTKSQQFFLKILGVSGIAVAIALVGLLVWKAPEWQTSHINDEKDRITLENANRSTLIQAFGGLFLVTTAYFSWRNLKATEEKQVTERFSKAVEQLGNANIHVRLGGIYALERISKDSERDYWQIMEILTAYVREKSHSTKLGEEENLNFVQTAIQNQHKDTKKRDIPEISTDIQAVLTVIKRRLKSYGNGEENNLDLRGADLSGAVLRCADLSNADLYKANLYKADLNGADLRGAILNKADLNDADLRGADMRDAYVFRAKNLTLKQLKSAKNWESAHYDPEFRAKLGSLHELESKK